MTEQDLTDEDLTAYLDDEADPETFAAIEAGLKSDPLLSERLAALEFPMESLRQAANAILEIAKSRRTSTRSKK